jgi:hypothetical protein
MGRKARIKRARREQRSADAIPTRAAPDKHRTLQAEAPAIGLPGQHQYLVLQPGFAGKDVGPPTGGPGAYRVVFTLARPGIVPLPEGKFSFELRVPGDSHIAIGAPAIAMRDGSPPPEWLEIEANTDDGVFLFKGSPNDGGFLATLETTFNAANLTDAEHKAYRAVVPWLSNWSAQLDVPAYIWRVHVTELSSHVQQINIVNPFKAVAWTLAGGALTKEFRPLASLYREAVNSNSPLYEFLCLFKIAEGVRNLRQRRAKEARDRGERFARPTERVPDSSDAFAPWLKVTFPMTVAWDNMALESIFITEARGRKVNDLLDKELVDVRNDIAHALSENTGEMTLSVDEAEHVARVNRWLPLMKSIVRLMLKNEFPEEYLPKL